MEELKKAILAYIKREGFFAPEWDAVFPQYTFRELCEACFALEKDGKLKKRDCTALAFEKAEF